MNKNKLNAYIAFSCIDMPLFINQIYGWTFRLSHVLVFNNKKM